MLCHVQVLIKTLQESKYKTLTSCLVLFDISDNKDTKSQASDKDKSKVQKHVPFVNTENANVGLVTLPPFLNAYVKFRRKELT